MARRPLTNGSSDVLTEVLVGLTVLGASALTVIAALRPNQAAQHAGGERKEREADGP